MEPYQAILTSSALTVTVGVIALYVNYRINRKNRRAATATQLMRDFYQDHEFTRDRLRLWEKLKKLEDEDYNFEKILRLMSNDETSVMKVEDVIALNRTAAFYSSVHGLIEKKEVDEELIVQFFSYNYNRFWEPIRAKFAEHSIAEIDKTFFLQIPILLMANKPQHHKSDRAGGSEA